MSKSKYLDTTGLNEIMQMSKVVKDIRNEMYKKYKIDLLDNDTISLSTFASIIQKFDQSYNCNFARNGEDGQTMLDNRSVKIETKTVKMKVSKKGKYGKSAFAFHAKGILDNEAYTFNIWDKDTLQPIRCYYVVDAENVKIINRILKKLSEEWHEKPTTKAGYDVIHLKEDVLISLAKSATMIDNCKVYLL